MIVEPAGHAMRILRDRGHDARGQRRDGADVIAARDFERRARDSSTFAGCADFKIGGDPRIESRLRFGGRRFPHGACEAQTRVALAIEPRVRVAEAIEQRDPLGRIARRIERDELGLERGELDIDRDRLGRRRCDRRGGFAATFGVAGLAAATGASSSITTAGALLAARSLLLAPRFAVVVIARPLARPFEAGRDERREVVDGRAHPRRQRRSTRVEHVVGPLAERRERVVADPLDAEAIVLRRARATSPRAPRSRGSSAAVRGAAAARRSHRSARRRRPCRRAARTPPATIDRSGAAWRPVRARRITSAVSCR